MPQNINLTLCKKLDGIKFSADTFHLTKYIQICEDQYLTWHILAPEHGAKGRQSPRSAAGAKLVHVIFNLQMSGKDWGIW